MFDWFLLKEYILTKNSHDKNELLQKMADLELGELDIVEIVEKRLEDDKLKHEESLVKKERLFNEIF